MTEFETIKTNLNDILTFDRSKFTVVGSPTITDDGIASGFSGSNKIFTTLDLTNFNSFEINISIKTSNININKGIFYLNNGEQGINIGLDMSSSGKVTLRYFEGSRVTYKLLDFLPTTNSDYNIKLKFENNTISVYVNNAFIDSLSNFTITKIHEVYVGMCNLGSGAYNYFNGSIDLKQFSITVDGIEVFNGNKTGIDTIKTDNFTKIGNPVISDDGIASGFSNKDYLKSSKITIGDRLFRVECDFTTGETLYNGWLYNAPISTNLCLWSGHNSGHTEANTSFHFANYGFPFPEPHAIKPNSSYRTIFEKTSSSTYRLYVKDITRNIEYSSTHVKDNLSSVNNEVINIGYNTTNYDKSIDLNAFKIYVDNKLVYQPTLRILYKLATDNRKIVSPYHEYLIEDNQDILKDYGYILESSYPIITQIPKRTDSNTNIAPRDLRSFSLSKDYISSLIPDNIRDTWTFERVVDIIYAAISDKTESGALIGKYHDDIEYYSMDSSRLSDDMNLHRLHDYGFSYLIDLLGSNDSVVNITVFLNLIKVLKGTLKGFKLILQLLGIVCTVSTWIENPELEIFTIQLSFSITGDTKTLTRDAKNDKHIGSVKYFAWKNSDTYYTVNSDKPIFEINKNLISYYGSEFPEFSKETGVMSGITSNGYMYLKHTDSYKEIILKITTNSNVNETQELFRGLDEQGSVVTLLNIIDGRLGSYVIEPDTNYYIRLKYEQVFDGYSYTFGIRTEDEIQFTNLAPVITEDLVTSVDVLRTFNGSTNLGMSYVIDESSEQIFLAKDITLDYNPENPYVNEGDTLFIVNENESVEPSGVALTTVSDSESVTTSLYASFATSETGTLGTDKIKAIQNLARNYLAPMVNITTNVVQEITVSNTYFSTGLLDGIVHKTKEISRSL